MKNRIFKPLFVALFLLTLARDGFSSHAMGIDLNYECVNNCTIRVHMRFYRDCTGVTPSTPTLTFTPQTPGCVPPIGLGSGFSAPVIVEVTPVCPGWPTGCNTPGAAINGVQQYYWFRDYDICSAGNCQFTLSWQECCRNGIISSGAAGQTMSIAATTLNTTLPICNNSPYFANPPVPYICSGQPYTFNQGAVDPDGDSLSYSLGPCFQGGATQVTYNAGFSPTAPLGPTWGTTIDPVTGDISMSPNPGSTLVAVLCVYVTEWRNGQAINNIVRDMQITVLNCPANGLPASPGITALSSGIQVSPFQITVCNGVPFTFNIQGIDPNVGQVTTMFWNQNIPTAQFYLLGNPAVQDTVTGTNPTATFSWTPTVTGLFTFLVTIRDNACPIIGSNQFTVRINVIAGLQGASAVWQPVGCTDIQMAAFPGPLGSPPYTYSWSGSGNLSTNPGVANSNLTHTYPGPSMYGYSVTITDNLGCTQTITDSLQVTTGPTANAGPDISMCSGFSTTLGAPNIPGQTYLWTPGTGIAPTNTAQPTISLTNPGPGNLTQTYTLTASDVFCTAVDMVTITVYPTPSPSIIGNLNICNGNSTTLTALGGTRFIWNTGDTTAAITVNPSQTTTYAVSVSNNGCASPPISVTVIVSPGPVALVTGPVSVCPGSNGTLTVVGGTSWNWSTGATTQTITLPNLQTSTTVSVSAAVGPCVGPPVSYTINILPTPIADFSSPTICLGQNTQFNDMTNDPTNLTTGWVWNFGDPGSGPANFSAIENPPHEFSTAGTFNATMIVTSSNGCKDTITKPVTVNSLPVPGFIFQNVCEGLPMTFTDQTPGTVNNWAWTFGDGSTNASQNPTHQFPGPNAYNVDLEVTDANGCQNKTTRTVFVHPAPDPTFSYTNHCFNSITKFEDLTTLTDPYGTLVAAWNWNFGDAPSGANNTSAAINPVHNYTPGNYSVSLTATSTFGCSSTITLPVSIETGLMPTVHDDRVCNGFEANLSVTNPYPQFNIAWYHLADYGTQPPFQFGNTYHTPPVIGYPQVYVITVMDNEGCETPPLLINANLFGTLNSGIIVDRTEVDIPNASVEYGISGYMNIGPEIVSLVWDFGDGNTSNLPNPVHQYTHAGVYYPSVSYSDTNGCIYKYGGKTIEVGEPTHVWTPNAFTPNMDNTNDAFEVKTQLITAFHIDIFDRWGKLVFETNDVAFKWYGKDISGTELPEGAYMFVIKATTYAGLPYEKSGSVTLIR